MAAVEVLERLESCGVSVSVDREELVLRPGSKVPPELLIEVRQHKRDLLALLAPTWPPTDAEELITVWDELGCPEIPLSPGIAVSNLRTWFHPALPAKHMAEHMVAVTGFIYEGLPAWEIPKAFTPPGLLEND